MSKRKDKEHEQDVTPARSGVLLLFTAVLFCGIVLAGARFFQIQVIQAPQLREQAENQRLRRIETPAQRGSIFDRSGRLLAHSVRVYTVVVDPYNIALFHNDYVEEQESNNQAAELSLDDLYRDLAAYFAPLLDESEEDLIVQFSRRTDNGNFSRFAVLARQISPEVRTTINQDAAHNQADSIEQSLLKRAIRNTTWELDYMRVYPMGEIASQVVGFVNAEGVGAAGIEMYYEDLLRGTPGVSFTERDAVGNIIPAGVQRSIEAQKGSDIILTIDAEITHVAQLEIETAVEDNSALSASAIVMNPQTGEIYASVSYPGFDSNYFNTADQEAIRNRALTDVLEPGSTIKPLTFAAAFDTGAIVPADSFHVPNSIQVGTRVISDAIERPTEQMSISRIMEVS
ncbi:MAG: penicillin-binding transpeptidase domain-containing protein, partial [Coriobacteriia bacterium]|nr:penicillin-binding transpeptidase domain-containing protein [Coriobacteriia bacterium]